MTDARMLIVDDDEDTREVLGELLSRDGYSCELVPSATRALETIGRMPFDLVICDVCMDGMDGLELLDRVRKDQPSLPVILMTAQSGVSGAVNAIKRGAFQYLPKPCDVELLRAMVKAAIDTRRRRVGETGSRPEPAAPAGMELVGEGQAMRALREAIDLVAASSAPVLLTGETGAGKELVARAIHARGPRREQPFVAVNTSAIPEELLEGELFGHVRGAFTSAALARKGLLTEASGGTLLLDEIGDMPLRLQAKLLRVIQFGEVRPVGSDREHHVDVRIIAATHRDVPLHVREGRFREDLYFRLNVLPLTVPPLRERREDIPALVNHLLAEARQRSPQSPVRSVGPEALSLLMGAPWPGNVRELASTIERLVVFTRDEAITPRHLSFLPTAPPGLPSMPPILPGASPPEQALWTLKHMTDAHTERVLAETGGNKQRAAEILDVDLSTLYRWQRARKN
jgi:two-component system response regulator HydG